MNRRCPAGLIALACGSAFAAPHAVVDLLPQARVDSGAVTLGQVAHVRSEDLALVRTLVNLPIGSAPRAGEPATLRREALATWVQRQARLAPEAISWGGAQQAQVWREAQVLAGERIAGTARAALQAWLAAQGVAGDVQLRLPPRDIEVPQGEVRLQARPLQPAALRARALVWVDIWVADRFVRAVPVALEVEAVAAPLQPLAGAALADVPPAAFAGEAGPPAVRRGDWAALHTAAGAVALESRVEVLQDGRPGQRVRVRQSGATGVIFARVLGPGALELVP